jgi:hypothetical protein
MGVNEALLTDLCPDGTEHEPVVETDELATNYWGNPETTIKLTITCAKCSESCRMRLEDERDESRSD